MPLFDPSRTRISSRILTGLRSGLGFPSRVTITRIANNVWGGAQYQIIGITDGWGTRRAYTFVPTSQLGDPAIPPPPVVPIEVPDVGIGDDFLPLSLLAGAITTDHNAGLLRVSVVSAIAYDPPAVSEPYSELILRADDPGRTPPPLDENIPLAGYDGWDLGEWSESRPSVGWPMRQGLRPVLMPCVPIQPYVPPTLR